MVTGSGPYQNGALRLVALDYAYHDWHKVLSLPECNCCICVRARVLACVRVADANCVNTWFEN